MPRATLARFTLLALLAAAPALAAPPADVPAPSAAPRPAPADSARHAPRVQHWRPWVEFGGAWVAGPAEIKSHYESGQGFAAGLESRPASRVALRGALDYQMIIATSPVWNFFLVQSGSNVTIDSTLTKTQTTGWLATTRAEAGLRLVDQLWVTGGLGGGYMHSGLSGAEDVFGTNYQVQTAGSVSNGWGWLWTVAARYDFEPAASLPLGVEFRATGLERDRDGLTTMSVRASWRIPQAPSRPHGPRGPREGRGGRGRDDD